MTETERRYSALVPELRADGNRIGGYAAMFDKRSKPLGPGFFEYVDGGAFARTLASGGNFLCRFEHEAAALLGTVHGGTLEVRTDSAGLLYDCIPPVNSPALELVTRGDVRSSSFAFRAVHDEWSRDVGGMPTRRLLDVDLIDVAPVVNPAYECTSVGVVESLCRKFGEDPEEIRALLENGKLMKLFKRTAATTNTRTAETVTMDHARLAAELQAKWTPEEGSGDVARGKYQMPEYNPAYMREVNTLIAENEQAKAKREAQDKASKPWSPPMPVFTNPAGTPRKRA